MPTGEQLAASLGEARTRLSEVRDRAKAVLEVDGGARLLMDNSGLHFGASIGIYESLFRESGVVTHEALASLLKTCYKSEAVRDEVEAMWEAEESWDKLLRDVDSSFYAKVDVEESEQKPELGNFELAPMEGTNLERARLDELAKGLAAKGFERLHLVLLRHFGWQPWRVHVAALEDKRAELESAKVAVFIVSFGVREGAAQWLKETGCKFPMYLDNERAMYKAFGLQRSLAMVYNKITAAYYGGLKAEGEQLHKVFEGDDPLQMGGDFTLDLLKDMELLLVYKSKTPSDRPSVESVIRGK